MIEFPIKNPSNIRKTLEDKDFRHFAKQLAYHWSRWYGSSQLTNDKSALFLDWAEVETALASARFWNIISASLAYDISTWLQASEFVDNVPTLVMEEYDQKYLVHDTYKDSVKYGVPPKYCYEQYFIYKELCAAFGVEPIRED